MLPTLAPCLALHKDWILAWSYGKNSISPSAYEQDLLDPSALWQDKTIAFVGDIHGNGSNFIKAIIFPSKAFDITDDQLVPTLANMTTQFAGHANETIGPFDANNPNTETISTRLLIPVPHKYVCLVLNQTFTPRKLWEQLSTVLVADGHTVDCTLLLNWIRIAATRRHNNPVDAHTRTPANHMGQYNTELAPVINDEYISRY